MNQNSSNMIDVAKDYVVNMLKETSGRKALILDQDTLTAVSLVVSKTAILALEVFLICTLDQLPDEKLTHMKAVIFCRPTDKNIKMISKEVQQKPKFASYSIYFSNKLPSDLL